VNELKVGLVGRRYCQTAQRETMIGEIDGGREPDGGQEFGDLLRGEANSADVLRAAASASGD
jgi:hypothetical protein